MSGRPASGQPALLASLPEPVPVSAHSGDGQAHGRGRIARCSYGCGDAVPSHPKLAFFEDRSEGSRAATQTCKHCRCYPQAHEPSERWTPTGYPSVIGKPHPFEAHGEYSTDLYYCGCKGWE